MEEGLWGRKRLCDSGNISDLVLPSKLSVLAVVRFSMALVALLELSFIITPKSPVRHVLLRIAEPPLDGRVVRSL